MIGLTRLPGELNDKLKDFEVIEMINGKIGNSIYHLENSESISMYLKVANTLSTRIELEKEFEILHMLAPVEVNTPEVILYCESDMNAYLLINALDGVSGHTAVTTNERDEIVKLSALALKKTHTLNFELLSIKNTNALENELK